MNPFALNADVPRREDFPRVEAIFRSLHGNGKVLYGMKILGGADPHRKESLIRSGGVDISLRFALTRPWLAGFTIGFSRTEQVDDIVRRIEALGVKASEVEGAAGDGPWKG